MSHLEKAVRDYNQGIYEAEQRGEDRVNKLNSLLLRIIVMMIWSDL